MTKERYIPLAQAARDFSIPYQSLHKWFCRYEKRHGQPGPLPLKVRSSVLAQYLRQRDTRARNGMLDLKRSQASTAFRTLQQLRTLKLENKEVANDDTV